MKVLAAIILPATLLLLSACASIDPATGEPVPPQGQRYTLEEVESRLGRLRPGLSKTEALLILGSPAEETEDAWIYRPSRSGVFVPAKALVIRFQDRQYVEHDYQPILFGGRVGLD